MTDLHGFTSAGAFGINDRERALPMHLPHPPSFTKCLDLHAMTQSMRKKGVKSRLEKQEQWNQFLPTPLGLVYTLLSLMPSTYQRDNLEAMLELFLEAQGRPLPEHCKTKSASALSRFLNIYDWEYSTGADRSTLRDIL